MAFSPAVYNIQSTIFTITDVYTSIEGGRETQPKIGRILGWSAIKETRDDYAKLEYGQSDNQKLKVVKDFTQGYYEIEFNAENPHFVDFYNLTKPNWFFDAILTSDTRGSNSGFRRSITLEGCFTEKFVELSEDADGRSFSVSFTASKIIEGELIAASGRLGPAE